MADRTKKKPEEKNPRKQFAPDKNGVRHIDWRWIQKAGGICERSYMSSLERLWKKKFPVTMENLSLVEALTNRDDAHARIAKCLWEFLTAEQKAHIVVSSPLELLRACNELLLKRLPAEERTLHTLYVKPTLAEEDPADQAITLALILFHGRLSDYWKDNEAVYALRRATNRSLDAWSGGGKTDYSRVPVAIRDDPNGWKLLAEALDVPAMDPLATWRVAAEAPKKTVKKK